MKLRLALAAASCLVLPLAAHAQPVTGPYVSIGAGTTIEEPMNINDRGTGPLNGGGKALFRPSYSGDIAVGYGLGNGFRIELNGNYYRNTVHKIDRDGGGMYSATGGLNTYGPMINVLYDIDAGIPVFPYVGAGAGYQWQHFDSSLHASNGSYIGGSKGSFAYNIIGGLAYPLPLPGLSLTAEYKFTQLTASRNYGNMHVGQSTSHTFLLGLRYQLFQPPPPPAPAPAPVAAPAPAPAKTYLVFFDWDKYNLTPRATQIIAQAAQDSKTQNVTTLEVNGYTDTSGTPQYNMGLSIKRAKAVAAQLVADGVPASEIEMHGYGETHLLVPTGPGVREPQNRRVEIIFH
ncbi:OmpA family protein [Acidocella sp.]|uniref:OmpA family protein n=1 Tax=Acidocella sp. TaxID=50710 RepID=UPI002619E3EB|nr:OmpA family protein [Acidocella sp.]